MNEKISDSFVKLYIDSRDTIDTNADNAKINISIPIPQYVFETIKGRALCVVEEVFIKSAVTAGAGSGYTVLEDFDGFHIHSNITQPQSYSSRSKSLSKELIFIPNLGEQNIFYKELGKLSGVITNFPTTHFNVLNFELKTQAGTYIDPTKISRWRMILRIHPMVSMEGDMK